MRRLAGWESVGRVERTEVRRAGGGAAVLWVLLAGSLGMWFLLALLPAAGHDQLWFLLMAERWLHGAALYGPEAFDSNPPGVVWVSAVPVLVAGWLRLPLPEVAKALAALLDVAMGAFALRVLGRWCGGLRRGEVLWLGFALVVLWGLVPARDLGQREALVATLCLPYVLLAGQRARWTGWLEPLAASVLAGVGFCLKPQQGTLFLAIELLAAYWVWRDRPGGRHRFPFLHSRQPWAVFASGVLFLFAVHRWAPLYRGVAVPLTLRTYWAIGHLSFGQLLWEAIELDGLAFAAFLCVLLPGGRRRLRACGLRRPAVALLVAGFAATVAYLLQGTGWYYQQLPAISFFGLALALFGLAWARTAAWRVPEWAAPATAGLVVLALGLTWHFSGFPWSTRAFDADHRYAIETPSPQFFAGLPPGTPVMTLGTSVDDTVMPVFRYRLTLAQRMNNLWLLPAILRNAAPGGAFGVPARHRFSAAELAEMEALQRRWVVEDMEHWRPKLVLVARCHDPAVQCQELEDRHDDLLAFFFPDPAFQREWQAYRPAGRRGSYDAYVRVNGE